MWFQIIYNEDELLHALQNKEIKEIKIKYHIDCFPEFDKGEHFPRLKAPLIYRNEFPKWLNYRILIKI